MEPNSWYQIVGIIEQSCHASHLQDVLQTLQGNSDDPVVIDCQQVAQRLDAAVVHQQLDLVGSATRGCIADSPSSLLLDVKLSVGQQANQRAQQVAVQNCLNLVLGASSDVRNGPASLLLDALLVVGHQEVQQARQSTAVDDDLSLHIIASDNVADSTEGRHQNSR